MADQVQHHVDTCLPTVNFDMKEVFPEFEPYPTTACIPAVDAATPQEMTSENQCVTERDLDFDSLFALLNSPQPSVNSTFSILPSKKDRGKPYFIHDKERILTTKRNEPIHLQLDTCKPGQKVLLTLRYSDQDYYDRPMVCKGCSHPYKSCQSDLDHNDANFCVKSRDGPVEYMLVQEGNVYHPTAVITVASKHEKMDLWAAFKCRNSCSEHKKFGADRTLRLQLLDDQNQELCRNEWSLRVCESAKRDHNLIVTKAESGSSGLAPDSSGPSDPHQLTAAVQPPSAQLSLAPVTATDTDVEQPPMKRVKVEEDTVVHYIDAASSSTQQMGSGRTHFRCVTVPAKTYNSHAGSFRKNSNNTTLHTSSPSTSGIGNVPSCFEGKPLLPIVPPSSAVVEAPAAAGVVPVMVYPKSEADKKLLRDLAVRLGMDIYNVST